MTSIIAPEGKNPLTLESPELVKAVEAAVVAEDGSNAKWVNAAAKLYSAGVRFGHVMAKHAEYKAATATRIRDIIVQAQKPNVVTLLMASSTLGFTDQERENRRYYKNRVDNVHMKRVAEHLKKFEESERGAADKKTLGEILAKVMQDSIDRIKKAKEDRIDFDAPDAILALKACKEIFLT